MKRARNAQDARKGAAKGKPAKNPHAVALGRRGGNARRRALSPARRLEISRIGVLAAAHYRKLKKELDKT